jgi:hypothetical protein
MSRIIRTSTPPPDKGGAGGGPAARFHLRPSGQSSEELTHGKEAFIFLGASRNSPFIGKNFTDYFRRKSPDIDGKGSTVQFGNCLLGAITYLTGDTRATEAIKREIDYNFAMENGPHVIPLPNRPLPPAIRPRRV